MFLGDLISVIVPVYNSERYIGCCVKSVLMQTYSIFELILIEDGSTDNSLEICEALCKKDKRIRLMKQNHRGVSVARNLGIEAAKGKYLFFLDSDDMIHPILLESLYKLQEEKHTVIAVGGIHYGMKDVSLKEVSEKTVMNLISRSLYLDNKKALKCINRVIVCTIGGKMISREAINSVRFIEGLSHDEDRMFIYQLLVKGADISVLCCNLYYYRRHKDSASIEFSSEAYRNRYRVERYICNCEMQSGRRENAMYIEWMMIDVMIEWYRKGRINQDMNLLKCIKNIAEKERKIEIFHQLRWWMKWYFYLTFYCYPLSRAGLIVIKNIQTVFKFIKRQISQKTYRLGG